MTVSCPVTDCAHNEKGKCSNDKLEMKITRCDVCLRTFVYCSVLKPVFEQAKRT